MGLAACLKYIDDPYVVDTVGLIVEQLANYMKETNFLGINGPGGPSGVEQKARIYAGGVWVTLLLKMAAMVIVKIAMKLLMMPGFRHCRLLIFV